MNLHHHSGHLISQLDTLLLLVRSQLCMAVRQG